MTSIRFKQILLATSVLASAALPVGAFAQQQNDQVQEVVVTATRRSDTVHNIPLSISAVTPQQVERQGLKSAQDIARVVPALRINTTNGVNGQVDVSVRGIRSAVGAATTGIYIDDVSITQRNTNNPLPGGTVFPQLFDLERVEVLRGPQGTLYGASSEGGTVRFITPQPSLSQYSARARLEGSTTDGGDPNYDLGLAVGGPIVKDKLGFRISGAYRYDGGYIDHVSRFTGATLAQNTNSSEQKSLHASVAWKPVEAATVTLSYLHSRVDNNDQDTYWANTPSFTTRTATGLRTYPAINVWGPYKSGRNTNIGDNFYTSDSQVRALKNPNSHQMDLTSLVIDYNFDKMTMKSITSYVYTNNYTKPYYSYSEPESQTPAAAPLANSPFVPNLLVYESIFPQYAKNRNLTQEVRFSSAESDSPLSWVAGVYYSNARLKGGSSITSNLGQLLTAVTGAPLPPAFNGKVLDFPQSVKEVQIAAFGEATYAIQENLKATAGLRITRDELNILAFQGGAIFFPTNPTALNKTVDTTQVENPITPKVGLQYIIDRNNNLYINASKGFRPGGANTDLRSSGTCAAALAQTFGGNFPLGYGSDSLWNYEAGAKLRSADGKLSLNSSVFRIDWDNVQTSITLSCGQPVTVSQAKVRSQGADVDATYQLLPGLVLSANVGFTDSKYRTTVTGGPGAPTVINKGDKVPYTPKWTWSLSGQYSFDVAGRSAFIRADYQHQSSVVQTPGPGTIVYQPDNFRLPATNLVSARAGVNVGAVELSLFANNLFNSDDVLSSVGFSPAGSGRTGCLDVSCTTYTKLLPGAEVTSFRPRVIGMSLAYRY